MSPTLNLTKRQKYQQQKKTKRKRKNIIKKSKDNKRPQNIQKNTENLYIIDALA